MEKYTAIKERAAKYTSILEQVVNYREDWAKELKKFIEDQSNLVLEQTGINATVKTEEQFENLESITVSLGKSVSGISENIDKQAKRTIIKDKGSLIFSQLFNGKVQAWMTYPLIEGLMQPKQPKMIGIYGPPEFNEGLILTIYDEFFKELIEWENYDDDQPGQQQPTRIGFGARPPETDEEV